MKRQIDSNAALDKDSENRLQTALHPFRPTLCCFSLETSTRKINKKISSKSSLAKIPSF
uniref:Uncharacterized protein n=1 Tax=Rhizophora mucronata TaxID=61149 RepID=A0A2P2N1R6_RHIMU